MCIITCDRSGYKDNQLTKQLTKKINWVHHTGGRGDRGEWDIELYNGDGSFKATLYYTKVWLSIHNNVHFKPHI